MSSFELTGTVVKTETLKSAKGNPYIIFQIRNDADKVFDLSLFGDNMSMQSKLKPKKQVTVKGTLSSREFIDKNNKTRNAPELRVSWIEEVKKEKAFAEQPQSIDTSDLGDIPF